VGTLNHLAINSRPDLCEAVSQLSKGLNTPSDNFKLKCYVDADLGGDKDRGYSKSK